MKHFLIILFIAISTSIFAQADKKDTVKLLQDEIDLLTAQNNRLRQTNIILNEKLHWFFEQNLRLVKDSAILTERIIAIKDEK
jgi:FtsZ-binding cell division protein ZapB